jgi:serine O-acetyltransferase
MPGPNQREAVSATEPDWSRERMPGNWAPSRQLLRSLRGYQHYAGRRGPVAWVGRKWNILRHRFWSVLCGAEIPVNTVIGGGLIMPHPNGVIINYKTVLGPNCLLQQQVTLGAGGLIPGTPIVGGHVDIGAGAKVLGGVRLGDHCVVGPNAVVLDDVPRGATVVGVPARVVDCREISADT